MGHLAACDALLAHGASVNFQCNTVPSGLVWRKAKSSSGARSATRHAGTEKPSTGRELENSQLATALAVCLDGNEYTFVSKDEWDSFQIVDLRFDDFIFSGGCYLQPAPFPVGRGGSLRYTPLHFAVASVASSEFFDGTGTLATSGGLTDEMRYKMHVVCQGAAQVKVVDLLLANGASPDLKDEEHGDTPLHLLARLYPRNSKYFPSDLDKAIARHCDAMCSLLVAKGASVNMQNDHGETPLHVAAELAGKWRVSASELCEVLISHGASTDLKSKSSGDCRFGSASEYTSGETPYKLSSGRWERHVVCPVCQVPKMRSKRKGENQNWCKCGWEMHKDQASGKSFFFHSTTGKKQWEPPEQFISCRSSSGGEAPAGRQGSDEAAEFAAGVAREAEEFAARVAREAGESARRDAETYRRQQLSELFRDSQIESQRRRAGWFASPI